jgi:chromosome segregation ATPase
MSIHNLKQVETFTAFLDFLSDPEKYRKLMAEIKETSAAYDANLARFKAFTDADEYRKQMEADYNAKMDELDKHNIAFEASKVKQKEQDKVAQDKVADMVSKANDRDKKLDAREAKLVGLEKQKEDLAKEQVKLESDREAFQTDKANLKKKEEALKAVLG